MLFLFPGFLLIGSRVFWGLRVLKEHPEDSWGGYPGIGERSVQSLEQVVWAGSCGICLWGGGFEGLALTGH